MLGPEAPLVAIGGGLAVWLVALLPRDLPPEAMTIVGAAGGFAAISLIFGSPVIAAVLILEIAGLGRARAALLLLPGLLAAAVGSLVYIGLGLLDRPQHERLLDQPAAAARLRAPEHRRLPVDDPAGGGDRARRPSRSSRSQGDSIRSWRPAPTS